MTPLESKMYVALMGARTIVAATANINPQALRIKGLVDRALEAYTIEKRKEPEEADAVGN